MDHLDIAGREHVASLDVLRYAKNVVLCLAWIAVALHIFSWITVAYTDTLDPLRAATVLPYGSENSGPSERDFAIARQWERVLQSSLTLGGFVGRCSALVLAGVFIVALLVGLSAALGGAADLTRACVWSLVALAMLVPWLRAPEDMIGVATAFHGFDDLTRAAAIDRSAAGGALSFVRYVLSPLLVALCLILAQLSFRRAYRRITAVPSAMPLDEV